MVYSFILLTVGLLVYAGIRPMIERRTGVGAGAEVSVLDGTSDVVLTVL